MPLLGVRPGMAVVDVGSGSGDYTVRLARRVGPEGRVYGQDIVRGYLAVFTADTVPIVPHPRLSGGRCWGRDATVRPVVAASTIMQATGRTP